MLPPVASRALVLPAVISTVPPFTESDPEDGNASPTRMTMLPPEPPVDAPVST